MRRPAHRTGLPGLLFLALIFVASPAGAGVLQDKLPEWLKLDMEYRVQTHYIHPFELGGDQVGAAHWTEQRGRIDLGLQVPRAGGVYVQVDLLDGVLFGDNGDYGVAPAPSSGLAVTSRWPNQAGWGLGLREGADPLQKGSYVPVLRALEPIKINQAWGQVLLPVGVLRVGRQPYNYGAGIAAHQGTRVNVWGVSRYAATADRVLFGTKLDQLFLAISEGLDADFDARTDRGLILALAYDWGTQDDIYRWDDDLHQVMFGLQWLVPEASWGGVEWRDIVVALMPVHRWNPEFATSIWAVPLRLAGRVGPVTVEAQYSAFFGGTREISEGFAILTSKEPQRQELLAMGAHLRVDWDVVDFFQLTLELNYASGDDDPRPETPVTMFSFARDFNVGLLMFEHILAFESARSAAVGIENLSQLDADSFPLTEIATDGRFTNAIALFPQVKFQILDRPKQRLHARLGVLMAWPAARGGVVDPVVTALAEDGERIDDDAVNFHGGDPGSYYGTEIDLQIQWTWADFFEWTVEAAVLFPGSSLENEHGHAVTAFLVENRFTFFL